LPRGTIPGIKISRADERRDLFAAVTIEVFHDKAGDGVVVAGKVD